MSFSRTSAGSALLLALVAIALMLGVGMLRLERSTVPPRGGNDGIDFESLVFPVESVRFTATDGVRLDGWLVRGEPGRGTVVLCHDFGSSKAATINLMIALAETGTGVLAFDFRGHGGSEGRRSTLGVVEKRDVLGAVALLQSRFGARARPLGVYGAGMGAHAAVLAAADRPAIQVLVLDGLYPDAGWPLARRFFGDWPTGVRHLRVLPETLYALRNGVSVGRARAAALLPQLVGRDLLLLSPAGDARLAAEIERMYRTIPEQRAADGNLVTLPATETTGLYGAERERHLARVLAFFDSRLR